MSDSQKLLVAIADGSDTAIAIFAYGEIAENMLDEGNVFIDTWMSSVDDIPDKGIWVWEGTLEYVQDTISENGEWRQLTYEEWESIKINVNPWKIK